MISGKNIDYNSFKDSASSEDLDMIIQKENQQISYFNKYKDTFYETLSNLDKEINIAVFSSSSCPDAATATPLLLEISRLNKNIHINFYDKEEHKDFLIDNLNEAKIPTFLNLDDDGRITAKYCEFPIALKKILSDVQFREEADSIIADFRNGNFNDVLFDELVDLVIGAEQTEYISFDKTKLPYKTESSSSQD